MRKNAKTVTMKNPFLSGITCRNIYDVITFNANLFFNLANFFITHYNNVKVTVN